MLIRDEAGKELAHSILGSRHGPNTVRVGFDLSPGVTREELDGYLARVRSRFFSDLDVWTGKPLPPDAPARIAPLGVPR